MHYATRIMSGLLAISAGLGCNSGDDALPTTPPTKVELVTDAGFRDAGAVAVSPDGKTFYVAASDEEGQPAIFSVDVASGSVTALHTGEPLLYPSDIEVSCDGSQLFVTDMGLGSADDTEFDDTDEDETPVATGGIQLLAADGSSISTLDSTGIARAAGIVLGSDCDTLFATGWTDGLQPALFTVPSAGGAATVIHEGEPLVSPTGVHVDSDDVAWVMDHLALNAEGEGMLFAITLEGEVFEVISALDMGRHGGVSLVPGGQTAVMPVLNDDGEGQLVTANTVSGDVSRIDTPHIAHPTGVAAARNAPVMAIAGEQSISIATFSDSE